MRKERAFESYVLERQRTRHVSLCATVGGGCTEGDMPCALAFQNVGFKGPFFPHEKTYSWGCLVSLGIGVKATGYVGSDLMIDNLADAFIWRIAWPWTGLLANSIFLGVTTVGLLAALSMTKSR